MLQVLLSATIILSDIFYIIKIVIFLIYNRIEKCTIDIQ